VKTESRCLLTQKEVARSLPEDHIVVTGRSDDVFGNVEASKLTGRWPVTPFVDRFATGRVMSLALAAVLAATFFSAYAIGKGDETDNRGADEYSIGLFGDMPYNALGREQYPALLADINRAHVAFSVHDGDLKAGGDGPCADSLYDRALNDFNSLEQPVIFTTGDNDWTDCWGRYGPSQMPYFDPIERLQFERMLFFSTDRSLGRHTLKLTRQTGEG